MRGADAARRSARVVPAAARVVAASIAEALRIGRVRLGLRRWLGWLARAGRGRVGAIDAIDGRILDALGLARGPRLRGGTATGEEQRGDQPGATIEHGEEYYHRGVPQLDSSAGQAQLDVPIAAIEPSLRAYLDTIQRIRPPPLRPADGQYGVAEHIIEVDDARFMPLIPTMLGLQLITGIVTAAGVVLAMGLGAALLFLGWTIEYAMLAMCCPLFLTMGVAAIVSHRKRSGQFTGVLCLPDHLVVCYPKCVSVFPRSAVVKIVERMAEVPGPNRREQNTSYVGVVVYRNSSGSIAELIFIDATGRGEAGLSVEASHAEGRYVSAVVRYLVREWLGTDPAMLGRVAARGLVGPNFGSSQRGLGGHRRLPAVRTAALQRGSQQVSQAKANPQLDEVLKDDVRREGVLVEIVEIRRRGVVMALPPERTADHARQRERGERALVAVEDLDERVLADRSHASSKAGDRCGRGLSVVLEQLEPKCTRGFEVAPREPAQLEVRPRLALGERGRTQ